MNTHIYTHIHTFIHTNIHTCIHTLSYKHTHINTKTNTFIHTHTYNRAAAISNGTPLPSFRFAPHTHTPSSSAIVKPGISYDYQHVSHEEQTQPQPQPSSNSSSEKGFIESLKGMLSPENRAVSIAIWVIWFSFGFSYYGVILLASRIYSDNSSNSDRDDNSSSESCSFDYLPIFLNSISEVVGIAAVTMVINPW